MVGSLIIMSCITLANMRRGVLLHKLILLEVCWIESNIGKGLTDTIFIPAGPWVLARVLHLVQPSRLRLVAFGSCHSAQYLLVAS